MTHDPFLSGNDPCLKGQQETSSKTYTWVDLKVGTRIPKSSASCWLTQ